MNNKIEEDDENSSALLDSNAARNLQASISHFAFASSSPTSTSSSGQKKYNLKDRTPSKTPISENFEDETITTGSPTKYKTGKRLREPLDEYEPEAQQLNKKSKKKRGLADPEVYAHLKELEDYLQEGLELVFCGINPGYKSAEVGHHFGNPNNHFWGCLHESGLTSERLLPEDDHTLPERFSIGLTNLVSRPTAEQAELSKKEQVDGVPVVLDKIARYRPGIVCFVGLGIADIFKSYVLKDQLREKKSKATYGLQPFKLVYPEESKSNVKETLFYAVSSTSGRVVRYQRSDKVKQFTDLKSVVQEMKNNTISTETLHVVTLPSLASSSSENST
ncbi:uracil-DNA glycosylase-like protein [Crucibulum laeve]|uniref:G/T mismatch-specific thymine DNA glycosylase n=1 Tax=Crucibulum laeve TaxID=68775 RepID=A0A5C3LIU7_9AGAR|nr:uracil-DNA glycosylase-like protein [Crucibulum laeve]